MNILHIDFTGTFNEDMLYQENLLTTYQSRDGHSVTMLATCYEFDNKGNVCFVRPVNKLMQNGVRLIRMNYHKIINHYITCKLRKVDGVFDLMRQLNPDIIFFHGPQTVELLTIVKYLKCFKSARLFIDNHADFSNSASNFISLYLLHKLFWRIIASRAVPYTSKFFGTIPARVDFLLNVYNIPGEKCELLLFGVDNDRISQLRQNNERKNIRIRSGFLESDFLIITGGKINSAKSQVFNLVKAITNLNSKNIKLLIFGSIDNVFKEELLSFVENNKVFYLGWLNSDEICSYFMASDLAIFPGRHSVLWEQATGAGLPCFFKYWDGTTHLDLGGNCRFLYKNNEEEIRLLLEKLINNPDSYSKMKSVAEEKGILTFSYRKIARQAIQN